MSGTATTTGLPARLAALVARAQADARATGRSVLASVTELVPDVDPLAALEAAARSAETSALGAALRMFWAHPRGGIAMAGLGAAVTIAPTGADRFAAADREWRALLDTALVDGAGDSAPVLMGGFSFEPDGARSALWRDFASTRLSVPALHLAAEGERRRLTLSTLVSADGATSVTAEELLRARSVMLNAAPLARDERAASPGDRELALHDVRPADEWRTLVAGAVSAIRAGQMEKVVLARAAHATLPHDADAIALLDHLRGAHRDAYVFAYWRGDCAFLGASPERLVRLAGGDVEASSLAGSARRGENAREDAALAAALLASAKDLAEHAMVRRALGDALARLCDDVTAAGEPSLLTLPHVHHLHTAVRAKLRDGHSLLDLVGALHPTPAVGGAPREPALRFIREHEQLDRGWYAAPIGWVGPHGGEMAVALRSALVCGNEATLFAGCGIVAGSDPARELAESVVKLRPMQSALAATQGAPACAAERDA